MKIERTDFTLDKQQITRLIAWFCNGIEFEEKIASKERLINIVSPQIVGFVDLQHVNRVSAKFTELYVPRDHRRNGIGKAMMTECEFIARASGCKTLGCVVIASNGDAQDFYKSCGFSVAWEFDDDHDRIMSKQL